MSIKFCKLILLSLLINSFIFPIYEAHAADVEVVWTDLVGATASGNDLTKTAGNAWGNGGGASTLSHTK